MPITYAYYLSALIARSLIYLVVLGRIKEHMHYIYSIHVLIFVTL